jgi:hypothetical protein
MCAGCAMAAVAGASGAKAWLQAHHMTWLTEARIRVATVVIVILMLAVSTISFSGTSAPSSKSHQVPATAAGR